MQILSQEVHAIHKTLLAQMHCCAASKTGSHLAGQLNCIPLDAADAAGKTLLNLNQEMCRLSCFETPCLMPPCPSDVVRIGTTADQEPDDPLAQTPSSCCSKFAVHLHEHA